jgi:hypothetical protein
VHGIFGIHVIRQLGSNGWHLGANRAGFAVEYALLPASAGTGPPNVPMPSVVALVLWRQMQLQLFVGLRLAAYLAVAENIKNKYLKIK